MSKVCYWYHHLFKSIYHPTGVMCTHNINIWFEKSVNYTFQMGNNPSAYVFVYVMHNCLWESLLVSIHTFFLTSLLPWPFSSKSFSSASTSGFSHHITLLPSVVHCKLFVNFSLCVPRFVGVSAKWPIRSCHTLWFPCLVYWNTHNRWMVPLTLLFWSIYEWIIHVHRPTLRN